MADDSARMAREYKTVERMIHITCHGQHHIRDGFCSECGELWNYVRQRLDRCPLRKNKPTCAKCPIHCYGPDMRKRIRSVMRYAGPRMLFRYPILTLLHFVDGIEKRTGYPGRESEGS